MSESAVGQSHYNVVVNPCAKILYQRIHIADISTVVDTSLARNPFADTDIATAVYIASPAYWPKAILLRYQCC